MKKIQMVDLKGQYESIKEQVNQSIAEILETTAFVNGPEVHSFQKELEDYLSVKHVIPCANGTDALQIAMMGLGLQPGDEVITADFTFAATVEVIALLQLTPVLVDVYPDSFNIDIEAIEKAITPKTKAIVPVHLFGQCANMDAIMALAEKHNLYVIEDNAQAIGANYTFKDGSKKKAGTIGHVGATSFFPSKNLGCYGDGGAICTNDDELANKLKMIASHGQSKRYYHDVVGCNSRLDTIQAAVLRIKLRKLDDYISARRKAADFYDNAFKDVAQLTTPFRAANTKHVFHQYTLQLTDDVDRDALVEFLASKDIPAMIYYPVPAHKQKMFAQLDTECGDLEITDWITTRVFSLPMHTELTEEQLTYITNHVKEFISK